MAATKRKTSWLPNATVTQRLLSATEYLTQLATALGVAISEERLSLYLKGLEGINEFRLEHAFDRALKTFKPEYGRTYPSIAELREWAAQWKPEEESTRELLGRPEKPPGWVPLTQEQMDEMWAESQKRLGEGAPQLISTKPIRDFLKGSSIASFPTREIRPLSKVDIEARMKILRDQLAQMTAEEQP